MKAEITFTHNPRVEGCNQPLHVTASVYLVEQSFSAHNELGSLQDYLLQPEVQVNSLLVLDSQGSDITAQVLEHDPFIGPELFEMAEQTALETL